jgi:hypothetical protein
MGEGGKNLWQPLTLYRRPVYLARPQVLSSPLP